MYQDPCDIYIYNALAGILFVICFTPSAALLVFFSTEPFFAAGIIVFVPCYVL